MEKIYWIIANGRQEGRFTLDELKARPDLTPETPVWREGLADWTVASALPELDDLWDPSLYADRAVSPGTDPIFARETRHGASLQSEEKPNTYLVWAILSCLCCCLPTGIVAIIYASKVTPAWHSGDLEAARKASEKAGWWTVISFVAGLIWTPFYMAYSLFTGVASL